MVGKKLCPHPLIKLYLKSQFAKSFRYSKRVRGYICHLGHRRGIHSTLRKKYYPTYKRSKRRKNTIKRGSSLKLGKSVDDAITKYVKNGRKIPKRCPRMAVALINFWTKTHKHVILSTQLPVHVKLLNCYTEVDVITKAPNGELFLWEVKTGFPPGGSRKKGVLKGTKVPNTVYNHWELQRYFTWSGLADSLQIKEKNSSVINVYEIHRPGQQVKISVEARKQPEWIKGFMKN